jgi:uncharacterized UPF0146 family protein
MCFVVAVGVGVFVSVSGVVFDVGVGVIVLDDLPPPERLVVVGWWW